MDYYRKIAISAGVLFIIATGADMLSALFLGPITATNYLVSVSENKGLVATGALLLFIGGAAAIGIAISLYPVLKKFNAGLALGAVGFRTVMVCFCAWSAITNNIKPAICKSWSAGCIVFPNLRRIGISRIRWGGSRCWGGAGFFHRVSAILHHILSNKTSSSMDIGLGSCCCHIDHVIIRANHSRSHRSWIYGTRRFDGASNAAARNGSCGMADSQRIQSIRNCFQVSSCG